MMLLEYSLLLIVGLTSAVGDDGISGDSWKPIGWNEVPETKMNIDQIIRYHNYPVENHKIITEDGYILNVQRIPSSPNYTGPRKSMPVFLQHGLMDSAATWVINPPSQSLGFILADHGYDVWLGNSRGNLHSKSHSKWSTSDKKFWDFSFEEMAKYDLPACIDYIRIETNSSKVNYVGHSQGTLIGFIEFSRNPSLAKKINKMVALAPVASVKNIKGAFKYLSKVSLPLKYFFKLMGIKQFLPSTELTKYMANLVCGNNVFDGVCAGFIFLMAGFDTSNLNQTRVATYIAHTPAGTSVKDVLHFSQNIGHDNFRYYDYGWTRNFWKYNQFTPPKYSFDSFKVPVALFSGGKDWLATPQDINRSIRGTIKSIIHDQFYPDLNHLDFVWGENVTKSVYQQIIKILEK